jgi:hypothetical protein
MGRFRADEAEHYGGNGGAGYFSLKNDKDVAQVRFLYDSYEDVEGYAVHEVEVDGKSRYVNCLRDYNSPIDDCPFCAAKKPVRAKLFVPLYNIDEDKVQIWDRGKKFFQKLSSISARYPDLSSHIFEIERNGKAGSTQTTYEIYEVSHDETTCADLPECGEVLGGIVLDKSADDMAFYLENEYFPPEDGEDEAPVRRRSARNAESESEEVPFKEDAKEERPVRGASRNAGSRRTSRGRGERF